VTFAYSIEVLQPHPYFRISPLVGEIPPNGASEITISFNPITLGTCTTVIRIFVSQHNFEPFDCVIDARAVSGLIESKELEKVETRLANYMLRTGSTLKNTMGQSMFLNSDIQASTSKSLTSPSKSHMKGPIKKDPVAAVLSKTFKSNNLGSTLVSAMVDTPLLNSKMPTLTETGCMIGLKKVIGDPAVTKKVYPGGVGSGNAFDAGAEWMTQHNAKLLYKTQSADGSANNKTSSVSNSEVVEGLRIPKDLNSTFAVNFVLTSEVGKLKPKDLKAAIDKNREEKRRQALEQDKIREASGGKETAVSGGSLDLKAILAEELLNVEKGDAFKRQLREMAFLADVDDVKKCETEKAFRVSEEFLGANMLSENDISVIKQQRKAMELHRKNTAWRDIQSRKFSEHIPATGDVKAGSYKTYNDIMDKPKSFDTNTNEIWSKRVNTLRRFISCVSIWLVRERASRRLKRIQAALEAAGVNNRETCKAFVAADNVNQQRPVVTISKQHSSNIQTSTDANTNSLSVVYSLLPNQALTRKALAESAQQERFIPSEKMARRVLFPKFVDDDAVVRRRMDPVSIDQPMGFDDRTFFQLTPRAEYLDMGYVSEPVPLSPVFYPPVSSIRLQKLIGSAEEKSIRASADSTFSHVDIILEMSNDKLFSMEMLPVPPPVATLGDGKAAHYMESTVDVIPTWLTATADSNDIEDTNVSNIDTDLLKPRPELRTYIPLPTHKETDPDWILRPTRDKIEFDTATDLRTECVY
jgi:hypothetical protein